MPRLKLTLFDLDNTLLTGDSDVLWCDFLIKRGILDHQQFSARNADMEARYKAGTVRIREFSEFYVGTLAGRSVDEWEPLRSEFLQHEIIPRIPQTARDLVNKRLDEDDLVAITTATNRFITELTARHLGVAHLIATETEMIDGVFSGRTEGQLNMREGKVVRLHAWLASNGTTRSDFEITAYSDSINDLPFGAALDVAKIVGVAATHDGNILEYAWDHPQLRAITHALPYFIALPTTSGTGSEVGRSSVVSEDDTHLKRVVFSAKILAQCVFADPELTVGLPASVTAATGIDALTHNIESYLSPAYHPLCDGIALEGARLAARSLVTAVKEPGNLQARSDMMMSSMMGAIAFQKDLGAVHSCAHALGAVCDLHHGLANALMIDTVLAWNFEVVPERFDELAHVCAVSGGGKAFIPWLKALKTQLGIEGGLASRGVTSAHLPRLIEIASNDICHQTNPRPCTRADFERLFIAAM